MSVAAPTIEASLDGRFISGLKDERVKAAKFYEQFGVNAPSQLVSFALSATNRSAVVASGVLLHFKSPNLWWARSLQGNFDPVSRDQPLCMQRNRPFTGSRARAACLCQSLDLQLARLHQSKESTGHR